MRAVRSTLEALRSAPWRFGFDAAVRVLARGRDPAEALRFQSPSGLAFPAADVNEIAETEGQPTRVTVGLMGLTGPSGVLPRHYSDAVIQSVRARSRGLADFLDLLSHRFVAAFARAGSKYRPARVAEEIRKTTGEDGAAAADPVSQALLSLTGYGTAHLAPRLLAGTAPLLHYAGLFALRPRSADRLAAMLSDWLGMQVEVVEFAGAWLALPPDQRTRLPAGLLPGAFCRLGLDASAGVRAWDPQARFVLRIGPLDRRGFEALLPDRLALARLVSLVRAYVGFELGFAINPVLAAREVPLLRLDATADPPPRLGWNTWVPGPAGGIARRFDAADALFEAEVIETRAGQG